MFALVALYYLPKWPPTLGQVIEMADIFDCSPERLLILTGSFGVHNEARLPRSRR